MIEEELVEAIAQEHFNYIAEGDDPAGFGLPLSGADDAFSTSLLGRTFPFWTGQWWSRHLSLRTAMSVVAMLASVVLARHLRDHLIEFAREALSEGGEERGDGRIKVIRVRP